YVRTYCGFGLVFTYALGTSFAAADLRERSAQGVRKDLLRIRLGLYVRLGHFFRVNQPQRHVFGLTGMHRDIFLPLGEDAFSRSAHVVIVGPQLGDREMAVGIGVDGMRSIAPRRLVGYGGMRHWLG